MNLPLMPKATAVWLIENTALTFKQIADFCGLHELEIKGIADGDVAVGIKAYNPILSNQLTRDEIEASSKDPNRPLKLVEKNMEFEVKKMVGTKYTPISQREDKPNAIAWLTKNYPILTDAQICKLVGSTKNTVDAIRNRKHWNMSNIAAKDPVMASLCTQTELQAAIDKAKRRQEREAKKKAREAKKLAEEQKIDIKYFNIIYEAIEHVEKSLSGLLEPDVKETVLGSAEIQKIFKVSTAGKIAGSKVISGEIKSKSKARIIRDGVVVYSGEILSIFREKNQVKEVGTGLECGISVKDFIDFKEKDVIESYLSEEIRRSI